MENRVVLITGGAGGIGAAAAHLFAEKGASVVVADYVEEAGKTAVETLPEVADGHLFVQVDVSDSSSVKAMVEKVVEHFGKIDVLINNAGITRDAMLRKMTEEDWHRVINVNLNGVYYCTREVAPLMIEEGSGVIINTSSVVGVHGNIGQTNYAATKSAVIGMTKTWAKELGPKGIRVNAVAPGFINTNMVATVPEKVIGQLVEKVPLRRLGKAEDVGKAYVYLASDDASYINGTVLEVTGGLTL
ncbi:3-oxoacyl-[acyl-carrier protein] reductase [Evansella vedderi]|uniref:3-oxoacyl-[acyl-carrier protein] reductase n=1 Tax=Evansella vedderi TaxID=38282 RepID=A0ABU0A1R4_9BACI|nr:3-oxoacyl-ACP reductase FabG [Evansella vedderi]MDQ0257431.1 3-oxoacyl-[acyl-carrier protein] reductase [Evansella vedderi]